MLNPLDLSGCSVMVTGASSGIGQETAVLLSQLGARVILVGRCTNRLELTASRLEGGGHHIAPFDLRSSDAIPGWMREMTPQHGPLQGVVHGAGLQSTVPVRMLSAAAFEDIMRINTGAAVGLIKGFRQRGVHADHSGAVFIASVTGLVGRAGIAAYSASKGALIALTKTLAMELAPEGIRVNCVAPGYVETPMAESIRQSMTEEQFAGIKSMHPLGLGTPRDVAHAVAFLLASTGRWITGTTLVVDGGYTAH